MNDTINAGSEKHDERRQFIRHPADVPLNITRIESDDEERHSSLRDISFGGLSFVTSDFFESGDYVTVSFPLVDEAVEIKGQIVWSEMISDRFPQKIQYGLRFLDKATLERVRVIEDICLKHGKSAE